mgnify:CR=1 FL=1
MAGFFDKLINRSVTANTGSESESLDEEVTEALVEENATSSETRTLKEVTRILEPLDLDIGIDEIRGLLYVKVRLDETPEQDEWSHPLVRRQRLNLEQSLLVAILRQHFVAWEQESGTGASQAQIAIDDLLPQLQIYLGDPGSESKERTRLLTLLDQLKGHGLVTSPDAHERIVIRPIIAHLADPMNLQALLAWLREQIARQTSPDNASEKDSSEEDV